MESPKIVALCIAAAVTYGVVHDQFTLRVCLEYFTIGHPPIFAHLPPTLHAAAWGVVATWWVGLILGAIAATTSRIGTWPKSTARDLLRPIGRLLVVMAGCSLLAGIAAYFASRADYVRLYEPLASSVPADRHDRFVADAGAHLTAYAVAFVGGLALCAGVVRRRYLRSRQSTLT